MRYQLRGICRRPELRQIILSGVHVEHVLAELHRFDPVNLWVAPHDLDVEAGAMLHRAPRHCADLDTQIRMLPLHRGNGWCGDVGAESIGRPTSVPPR